MSVAAPPVLAAPYRGLAPFGDSELDALLFFGRERETEIAVANLIAARLTLLYGPSGVGKTSLLRAGVARRIRELGDRRAVGRGPDVGVVVFSSWADDPVRGIAAALAAEIGPLARRAPQPPSEASLADVLEHWSAVLDGDICLVLDQFEEYFAYHDDGTGPGTLLGELPEVVLRPGLRTNVLLSLRDDSLARLDVLAPRIPALYANALRLDRLDRTAARAAIVGPVQRWNEIVPPAERVDVEPELVEDVIAQSSASGDGDRVEAPYLQLVLERLWNAEHDRGSCVLRRSTLRELGGAAALVRDHLDRALAVLGLAEQDAAALMFEHLVTPSGTKIAHRSSDLAQFAHLPTGDAAPVLAALGRERILRSLDEGEPDGASARYEIFHDVLGTAILEWRARHELEHERAVHLRRQRRLVAGLLAAVALLVVMGGLTAYAFDQRRDAQHHATAAQRERASAQRQTRLAQAARTEAQHQAAEATKQRAAARSQARAAEKARQRAAADEQKARRAQAQAAAAALLARQQRDRLAQQGAELQSSRQDALAKAALAARESKKAKHQAAIAKQQTALATAQKTHAQANGYAFDALARVGRDPEAALRLALQGYRLDPKLPAVERALRAGLLATKSERILPAGGGPVQAALFDRAGARVMTAGRGGVRIFDTRSGHLLRTLDTGGAATAIAFSPDGTLAATGAADGTVTLWDAATGAVRQSMRTGGRVESLDFSPDGRLVAAAAARGTVRVWEAATGLALRQIGAGGLVRSAKFSADGSKLLVVAAVTAAQKPARLYSVETGELLVAFTQQGQITTAALSPDGNLVATGGRDDLAALWDAHDGHLLRSLTGHRSDVLAVAFSQDGRQLVTASADDTARLWDTRTFENANTLTGHTTAIVDASFSPDGTHVVTASTDRSARIWATADGELQSLLLGSRDAVSAASYSPDGTHVLTAGADGNARTWDARPEPLLSVVGRQPGRVQAVAWFPDGVRVASAGADGTARVWDTRSHRELLRVSAGTPLTDVAVSADGRRLAAAGTDGTLRVWKVAGGAPTLLAAGTKPLRSVAFSGGGLIVAGGDDGRATVWRLAAPRAPVLTLSHPDAVLDAVFSPDGTLVATASADAVVRLWHAGDGRLARELTGHADGVTGLAFSRDGTQLATSSRDKDGRIWNVADGRTVRTLRGHSSTVFGVAFSPDGRWVATAGPIKAAVWATTGDDLVNDRLFFVAGPEAQLTSVAFAPTGWRLAVSSFDGTLRTYDCALCGGAGRLAPLARERLRELAAR